MYKSNVFSIIELMMNNWIIVISESYMNTCISNTGLTTRTFLILYDFNIKVKENVWTFVDMVLALPLWTWHFVTAHV